jgi:hypothetical protein
MTRLSDEDRAYTARMLGGCGKVVVAIGGAALVIYSGIRWLCGSC